MFCGTISPNNKKSLKINDFFQHCLSISNHSLFFIPYHAIFLAKASLEYFRAIFSAVP